MQLPEARSLVLVGCSVVIAWYFAGKIHQHLKQDKKNNLNTLNTQENVEMDATIKKTLPSIFRGTSFLSRLFGGFTRFEQPESLKVMGSVMLSPKDRVCVLEIGDSWLVVGSGSNGLTTLAQLHRGGRPLTEKSEVLPSARALEVEQRSVVAGLVQDVGRGSLLESEAGEIAESITSEPSAQEVSEESSAEFQTLMEAERVASAAEDERRTSAEVNEPELPVVQAEADAQTLESAPAVEVAGDGVVRDEDGFPDPIAALRAVEEEPSVEVTPIEQVVSAQVDEKRSFVSEPVVAAAFVAALSDEEQPQPAPASGSKKSFLSVYSETKSQVK